MTFFAIGLLVFAAIGVATMVGPEIAAFCVYIWACARRWLQTP